MARRGSYTCPATRSEWCRLSMYSGDWGLSFPCSSAVKGHGEREGLKHDDSHVRVADQK